MAKNVLLRLYAATADLYLSNDPTLKTVLASLEHGSGTSTAEASTGTETISPEESTHHVEQNREEEDNGQQQQHQQPAGQDQDLHGPSITVDELRFLFPFLAPARDFEHGNAGRFLAVPRDIRDDDMFSEDLYD